MKLAASNIAWPAGADAEAAAILSRHRAVGVEVAPTKVWPKPAEATDAEILAHRAFWERHGIAVVAMQALLFGRQDLTLFESADSRERTFEYLCQIIRIGSLLGAGVLVFGSPKNRLAAGRPRAEVWRKANKVFRRLGEVAARHGLTFCIEPNPPQYGCDFITTVADAAALVTGVGHPGFGLHLDAGGMALTGESPDHAGAVPVRHFHVSEPNLAPVGESTPHPAFAAGLRQIGYDGWYSVETRCPDADWQTALDSSLASARLKYGDRPSSRPGRS